MNNAARVQEFWSGVLQTLKRELESPSIGSTGLSYATHSTDATIFLPTTFLPTTIIGVQQMANSPMEVFQLFGQGMMSGTDSWKDVVADEISFCGPVDQVKGIAAFAELNAKFLPAIKGNTMHRAVESGNYVITQVSFDISTPSGKTITLDMSEWYEIKDGKIQSIKVYYDAEEFRKEMSCGGE